VFENRVLRSFASKRDKIAKRLEKTAKILSELASHGGLQGHGT
jgi:hypothetical protein